MLPILEKNKIISFREYVNLFEKFDLTSIEYGTDLVNKNFDNFKGLKITYFEFDSLYGIVVLNSDGEIGYGLSSSFSKDYSDYIDDLGAFNTNKFLTLLNNVIFIVFELINKFNITYFYFAKPKTQKLAEFYSHIFESPSIINLLNKYNFDYKQRKLLGNNYIFEFNKKHRDMM